MPSTRTCTRWLPLLVLLAVAPAARLPARDRAPLRLEQKIELPGVAGRIDHLSIDAKSGRLFVAALGNGTVEVVDVAAGRRVRTLRGLAEPQGVLVVPQRNRLVVANGGDGSVRVFDATTLAPLAALPLGDDADNVRLDPAAGRVFVGYGSGALRAIDLEGRAAGPETPLGAHPESFQLERRGTRAFVNLPDARSVAVVDRERGRVLASWKTGSASANFPMALDEGHARLFVVCRTPARLVVLKTDSGALAAELPTVGDSDDVFYDDDARRIYVTGGEGAVVVYQQQDPDRYREIARVPTAKGARTSLLSRDLGRLFVAARREGATPAAIWVFATR